MSQETNAVLPCAAVVERLVETGGRPGGDPGNAAVEEHVRSCMSCFRAMTELRDLPRVANALRATAPAIPPSDDRFWETLARQTTDAVAVALGGPTAVPAPRREVAASPRRRRPGLRTRFISVGALAVAAAASWLVVVHRPTVPQGPAATDVARLTGDEGGSESLSDVADLDSGALRRLLDRMGHHAPAALAGGAVEETDTADVPADDDTRVTDEVAELDGPALRRVATSLEKAAL